MAKHSGRFQRQLTLSTCLTAAVFCLPVAAFADAAAPPAGVHEVEQVTVTANRREVDLQRTPLAISAVTSQSLDKSFTNELAGLNAVVPSLEITKTSGFENIVTIRGVGSETPENAPTTVPGVSVFIDGVYIANTVALDETLFDVDHIEVLRGPQGALYGQSSIGGAISIVTKPPKIGEFSGSGDVSLGDYSLSRVRAQVNLPINDTMALRLSAQKYDHEGFTENLAIPGNKLDDAHDNSEKASFLWKPNDAFSATLTGQWYHAKQNGAAQKNINDPYSDPRKLYQDYPSHFDLSTQLYHLNLEYKAPYFIIKSVSAYQGLKQTQQENSSRSAFSILNSYDDVAAWNTNLKNYNQEIDILSLPGGKLEWIVGAFGLDQISDQFVAEFEGTTANPNLTIQPDIKTNPPSNLAYGNLTHVERRSYSAFAQATYHFTDKLRLTGGIRTNHDSYTLHSNNFSAFGINNVSRRYKKTVPTWRVELDDDLTPTTLAYVSVARGYKPGGLNGIYGQFVIPPVFKPETNTAYQVGLKNTFMDKRLRLNVDAFYYDYKNMQYIENDPVPFDGGMDNIPSIKSYGLEAEGAFVSSDGRLSLNANIALEASEVDGSFKTIDSTVQQAIENNPSFSSPCAFGGAYYNPACWAAVVAAARDINGKSLPAMPKVSGSVNAAYRFDVINGTLTPRIEYVYRGSEWARIFNEPVLDKVKSYAIVNLNVEYALANSPLRLSLAVTNLTDKAGINSRYTDPYGTGQTSQQYIPPRQVIVTAAYKF
jgi:iron complex outermembrane receptor protein